MGSLWIFAGVRSLDKSVGASHLFVSKKGILDQRQHHAHTQKERGGWHK